MSKNIKLVSMRCVLSSSKWTKTGFRPGSPGPQRGQGPQTHGRLERGHPSPYTLPIPFHLLGSLQTKFPVYAYGCTPMHSVSVTVKLAYK